MKRLIRRMKCLLRLKKIRQAGNHVEVDSADLLRLRLLVRGTGNRVKVGKLAPGRGEVVISLFADDSTVEIGEGVGVSQSLAIGVGMDHPNFGKVKDVHVSIGGETTFEQGSLGTVNSHARLAVGRRCMFAAGVSLSQTDMHPICEHGTDRIVNRVRELVIGDDVWIGAKVTILKNSVIADGCVVGLGSVVSGKFTEPHSVVAGNPARQIPNRKIDWKRSDPRYIANEYSDEL